MCTNLCIFFPFFFRVLLLLRSLSLDFCHVTGCLLYLFTVVLSFRQVASVESIAIPYVQMCSLKNSVKLTIWNFHFVYFSERTQYNDYFLCYRYIIIVAVE